MKAAILKTTTKKATDEFVKRDRSTGALMSRTRANVRKKRAATNDRYEMRIDSVRRENWERAKTLLGYSTLKDYLTHLADLDAEKVIEKHEKMTLTNDVFDMFVVACENASKPNDALLAASKLAKEQGF